MISLETTNDIEILKELINGLGLSSSNDEEAFNDLREQVVKLYNNFIKLKKENQSLGNRIQSMEDKVQLLENNYKINYDSQLNTEATYSKERKKRMKKEDDFVPYDKDSVKYQELELQGQDIIHIFLNRGASRKTKIPINVFELLAIIEKYRLNNNSLKVKEVNRFCKMFSLTKSQFSKIFYNLTIGSFNNILSKVDKMIGDSVFTYKKTHIYRNGHDTKMNFDDFKELASIYVNDPYPFNAVNKIIRERDDIDPFDLLITLRKSASISKILEV